ncbi:MAG: phage tail length tape measure family protein [Pseudomonadota bacterium]|nr:phage tail length tape measure family protein [Pseudomonadota bacterium]
MNDTSVIMRRNAEAQNAASEAAQKFLAPLQRQIDLFGASRAEVERYNAAQAGLSATTQKQAAALGSAIDALHRDEQAARSFAAEEDRATKAADAFLKKLNEQVATLGMNAQQLQSYRAAQLGVTDAAAPLIAKLGEAGAGAGAAGKHMEGMNFQTVAARRELLVLAHEMSQGNFQKFGGSLMVLGEQTGAASLLFSAMGLTVLGVVGALGLLVYGAIKGASEQKHMNDALIMTGNYAGLTSDSLNALAHAAVEAGGSIGEAKKVATELAASGKFTGTQIAYITDATVAWEHATGQSIKSIISSFESLAVQSQGSTMRATEVISRATVKLDDTYHFLTESVYEQIRALEKEGDAKGASALATETFARVTKDRAEDIIHNLGGVARGWNSVKEAVGAAADAVGDWGKRATPATAVKNASFKLQQYDQGLVTIGVDPDKAKGDLAAGRMKIVLELTDAVDKLNKADAVANAASAATVAESRAVHAASRIAQEDQKLEKKGLNELQLSLRAYAEDIKTIKAVNPDSPLVSEQAIADGIAARTKAHTAAVKGADDRAALMQGALAREQANLESERSVYDSRVKMLDTYHNKLGLSDTDFYAGRAAARAEYIAAEAIAYARETAVVQGYRPKNAEEIAANKNKYDELVKQHKKFVDEIRNAGGEDSTSAVAAEKKSYDEIAKATVDAGAADMKRLEDSILKQREHNATIGQTKEQIALTKQAVFDLDTTQRESDAEYLRGIMAKGGFDEKSTAVFAIRLHDLDEEIARRKILSGLVGVAADAEAGVAAGAAARKLADMAINDWKNVGASIADSLSEAFGAGGKAIGKMFKAYADGQAAQLRAQKELGIAKKLLDSDLDKADAIRRAELSGTQAQVKSYGDMADAAQGYFKEGSRGYEAIGAASKILHAAEFAMNIAAIAPAMAAGAAQLFAQSGWAGFAGVAAMAAIIAGFGVAVSSGGAGGGGQSAAEVQKTQGTGSVFGDSSAKSNSIARGIELSASNSNIQLNYTAGMLAALKSIDASMSGLANLVVGASGVTDGSNLGIQTGTIGTSNGIGTKLAGAQIGSMIGSILGPIGSVLGAGVGALVSKLWGKTTQNIVDSGLQLGGSVAELQSGKGFQQYASVDTTKSSWFGLSKSTSNSVKTAGLDDGLASQFGLIFQDLETALDTEAGGLGVREEEVTKALASLVIAPTKVSLKDLKGDDLTAAINGVVSKTMDGMAAAAFPGLDSFRKVGEGYAETVMRLATDSAKLDGILGGIGGSFGATGIASLDARESLISMAGGIDELASKTKDFAGNYLSQAEQLAPVQQYLTERMTAMGLAAVQTRDDFKKVVLGLVESGALATAAGAGQYTELMELQEAFAKTHAATVDLTMSEQAIADQRKDLQKKYDELTKTTAQLHADERDTIPDVNLALYDQVYAQQQLKDAATAASEALKSTVERLISTQTSTLAYRDSLMTGSLSTLTPMQKYLETQRQYAAALAKSEAKPDDTSAASAAQAAATAFLTASQVVNASSAAYVNDRANVLSDMTKLADIAGAQITDAQKQLDMATQQVTGIATLNTTAVGIQQAIIDLAKGGAVVQAPALDMSSYTTASNESQAVLVAEIKRLNASMDEMKKAMAQRNVDARDQHVELVSAVDEVAPAVGEEIVVSANQAQFAQIYPSSVKPR